MTTQSPKLTRRLSAAQRLAAGRASRTSVVTILAFSVARWGMHNVSVAVFATFTGLAVTGIADFGGSVPARVAAGLGTVTLGLGLTALGTRVSSEPIGIACAAMFLVATAIALSGLLGGYAAAASNALILFYVVAAGSPAPPSAIADRVAGVALGGALAVIASGTLWPAPRRSYTLPRLGSELSVLAARLRRLAGVAFDGPSQIEPSIRAEVDAFTDRPAAPTRFQRAELYLLNDIERLDLPGRESR